MTTFTKKLSDQEVTKIKKDEAYERLLKEKMIQNTKQQLKSMKDMMDQEEKEKSKVENSISNMLFGKINTLQPP